MVYRCGDTPQRSFFRGHGQFVHFYSLRYGVQGLFSPLLAFFFVFFTIVGVLIDIFLEEIQTRPTSLRSTCSKK